MSIQVLSSTVQASVEADGRSVIYALSDFGRAVKEKGLAIYMDGTGNTAAVTCAIFARDSKDSSDRYFEMCDLVNNALAQKQFQVGNGLFKYDLPLQGSEDYIKLEFATSVATVSIAFVE